MEYNFCSDKEKHIFKYFFRDFLYLQSRKPSKSKLLVCDENVRNFQRLLADFVLLISAQTKGMDEEMKPVFHSVTFSFYGFIYISCLSTASWLQKIIMFIIHLLVHAFVTHTHISIFYERESRILLSGPENLFRRDRWILIYLA